MFGKLETVLECLDADAAIEIVAIGLLYLVPLITSRLGWNDGSRSVSVKPGHGDHDAMVVISSPNHIVRRPFSDGLNLVRIFEKAEYAPCPPPIPSSNSAP